MALLDSEVVRLKFECGYHLLDVGAEPYIGYVATFSQVIQPYLEGGAATTSATAVTATSDQVPVPVAITLTSPTGFAAGCRVWVDVDGRQEVATAQSLSGSVLTLQLAKAHSGTYPVMVDGGEGIVRGLLRRLDLVQAVIGGTADAAGIKKVDEIEFFGDAQARTNAIYHAQIKLRDELCSALGVANAWRMRQGAGSTVSPY